MHANTMMQVPQVIYRQLTMTMSNSNACPIRAHLHMALQLLMRAHQASCQDASPEAANPESLAGSGRLCQPCIQTWPQPSGQALRSLHPKP